jgi:hypothetical protein
MTASFVKHRRLYDVCSGLKMFMEINVFVIPCSRFEKINCATVTKMQCVQPTYPNYSNHSNIASCFASCASTTDSDSQ